MSYLKYYEGFTKQEREDIINNGLTYLKTYKNTNNIKYNSNDEIIRDKISYGVTNNDFDFEVVSNGYSYKIIYNDIFKNLVNQLFSNNLSLDFSVDKRMSNLIDLDFDLYNYKLERTGVGYLIYKTIIKHFGYITSYKFCTEYAKNTWNKIIIDGEFYTFTSNFVSGAIYKNVNNDFLKECLSSIKRNLDNYTNQKLMNGISDIIFDSELSKFINNTYGSTTNIS